jgi:hypothetical protein
VEHDFAAELPNFVAAEMEIVKAHHRLTRIIRQLVVYFCRHRGKCAGKGGKLARPEWQQSYRVPPRATSKILPSRDIGEQGRTTKEISGFVLISVLTLPFLKP